MLFKNNKQKKESVISLAYLECHYNHLTHHAAAYKAMSDKENVFIFNSLNII